MSYLRNYHQGRSERVLMLLVESGILYCIFWVRRRSCRSTVMRVDDTACQVVLLALAWAGIGTAQVEDERSGPLVAQSIVFNSLAQLCVRSFTVPRRTSLTLRKGIYPTVVIVVVYLQGVTYDPGFLTGRLPGLNLENSRISTELEFAHGSRAPQATTMRRSLAVSVGLPTSSIDPNSEQDLPERQQRDEDKKSVKSARC